MNKLALLTVAGLLALAAPATAEMLPTITPAGAGQAIAGSITAQNELSKISFAGPGKTANLIIGLNVANAPDSTSQRAAISTAIDQFHKKYSNISRQATSLYRRYTTLPYVAVQVNAPTLKLLSQDKAITSITVNHVFEHPELEETQTFTSPNAAVNIGPTWNDEVDGVGLTAAIIGDGVDAGHVTLEGKLVDEACFTSDKSCTGNDYTATKAGAAVPCVGCSLGTQMASIIAGRNDTLGFKGLAHAASIAGLRIYNKPITRSGEIVHEALESNVLAALDRLYANRDTRRIDAIVLMLEGDASTTACNGLSKPVTEIIGLLKDARIPVIAGSGDNGLVTQLAFPACISNVVSVGSTLAIDGECDGKRFKKRSVNCYSNNAANLSLLAPGTSIKAATSSVADGNAALDDQFIGASGTPIAAAEVAAAYMLVKQAYGYFSVDNINDVTTDTIITRLKKTGTVIKDYRKPSIINKEINIGSASDVGDQNVTVTVKIIGSGQVDIAAYPKPVSCKSTCSTPVTLHQQMTLTPSVPDKKSVFKGWIDKNGRCKGTGSCKIWVRRNIEVTAKFGPASKR